MEKVRIVFCLILALLVLNTGCTSWLFGGGTGRNPLSKYNCVHSSPGYIEATPEVPKTISDDVQSFFRLEKIPLYNTIDYYKDATGRYAVRIIQIPELPKDGEKTYEAEEKTYYIFYDKNNLRTKVQTYSEIPHSW